MTDRIYPTIEDLRYIRVFPDRCCAEVSRGGELQPCNKTAVAVTGDTGSIVNSYNGHWWPVCPHHSRGRQMVSLAALLTAFGVIEPKVRGT